MPVRAVRILLVVLVLAAGAGPACPQADLPSSPSLLSAASWTGSAYSHRAGGFLCWVDGDDGSLRVEVNELPSGVAAKGNPDPRDPLDMLDPLLTRTGTGWTLILGPDDAGTLNAWGREWKGVPRGLAQMVRLVTAALADDGAPEQQPPFAVPAGPPAGWAEIPRPRMIEGAGSRAEGADTWRCQLPSLEMGDGVPAAVSGFRSRMVARGRGAGGRGEIVTLERPAKPDAAGFSLAVTSTRRPGILRLGPVGRRAVPRPEPEVFLPLWPLSQFLESP